MLHILDGGVGLDIRIDGVRDAGRIQQGGHLGGHAEFDQIGIRCDKDLFEAATADLIGDCLDCACAVIGCFVEHELLHTVLPPCTIIFETAEKSCSGQIKIYRKNALNCVWQREQVTVRRPRRMGSRSHALQPGQRR